MNQELIAAWSDKTLKYRFEDAAFQEEKTPQEKLIELITKFVEEEDKR